MMLPSPRVVVIDDDENHLRSISNGLNKYGAACLYVHFVGDTQIKPCPHVRVIFADLHLNESGAGSHHEKHFSTIGGIIEEMIKPTGPYAVVLWTRFADQAPALGQFLEDRLAQVPKPYSVVPLDKMVHLDAQTGTLKDADQLVLAISKIVQQQSQITALLNWEERVLGATAETVSAIIGLTLSLQDPTKRASELRRLLGHLAREAVGESHVEKDHFQAVNEALLPILADRVAFLRSPAGGNEIWASAFSKEDSARSLSGAEASKLNRFLHIETDVRIISGSDRGAVIQLPQEYADRFEDVFGLAAAHAAEKQFLCAGYTPEGDDFRWVLIQVQATCDFAQKKPGPLPFVLALEMPGSRLSLGQNAPASFWQSPLLELRGERLVCANYRFQISLPIANANRATVHYRIREPLLSDLVYKLHSYGARPGFICFREKKEKKPQQSESAAEKLQKPRQPQPAPTEGGKRQSDPQIPAKRRGLKPAPLAPAADPAAGMAKPAEAVPEQPGPAKPAVLIEAAKPIGPGPATSPGSTEEAKPTEDRSQEPGPIKPPAPTEAAKPIGE